MLKSHVQELEDIKNFIKSDIQPLLKGGHAGYFPIPLLVFTLVNYCGALWSGKPERNEQETVDFIKRYFGPEYQSYAGLIYVIYRHGISHERIPKVIQLRQKGRIISWYIRRTTDYKVHLKPAMVKHSNGKRRVVIRLSLPCLVKDVLIAIDSYKHDLISDSKVGRKLRKNFRMVWKEIRSPKNEVFMLQKYKYLDQKEFDNLRREIKTGLIEIKGS